MYAPRRPLPPLPRLDVEVLNQEMAGKLGIAKSTLLSWMRSFGLRNCRRVSLGELLDLELTSGRAAHLLGCSRKSIRRWIEKGQLPAARSTGGSWHIALRDILVMRRRLAKAAKRSNARRLQSQLRY